jgi:glycosidase
VLGKGDGLFDGETRFGRVTGNNAATWTPALTDWYETVKLNYGYDFTTGAREYPTAEQPGRPIPDTWLKMDEVLAHWQALGVDGFRCDMAHMVPVEFWAWLVARARRRKADVLFVGEAYDNDPMKVTPGNVMLALLHAGFDAVYDDPSYKVLKGIYDGPKWANDLDTVVGEDFLFQRMLRYAENHDEVRLAGKGQWGEVGMEVGRAVSAILYGLSRGPVLLYSGQEVGEPALGPEGFGGDNARTTIFDYWSMPEMAKWVNGHRYDGGRLSPEQKALRDFYTRLLNLVGEPAFRDGESFRLNYANVGDERFGRLPGEPASGHWLYAYLRFDAVSGQRLLVVVNLHPSETMREMEVILPREAVAFLRMRTEDAERLRCVERLAEMPGKITIAARRDGVIVVRVEALPALMASYVEMR